MLKSQQLKIPTIYRCCANNSCKKNFWTAKYKQIYCEKQHRGNGPVFIKTVLGNCLYYLDFIIYKMNKSNTNNKYAIISQKESIVIYADSIKSSVKEIRKLNGLIR